MARATSQTSRIAAHHRSMVDIVSDQNRTFYPVRHGIEGVNLVGLPASWAVPIASEEYEERLALRARRD